MAARTAKKQDTATPSFEQAIARLQEILTLLDNTDTELEQAIALSEESSKLIRYCRGILANAELRIKTLENNTGDLTSPNLATSPEQNETDDEFSLQ